MVDGQKLSGDGLACLLEHGPGIFNTEHAPDGLSYRSWHISADPVDCIYGRVVQRLSVLVETQIPVLTTEPRAKLGATRSEIIKLCKP